MAGGAGGGEMRGGPGESGERGRKMLTVWGRRSSSNVQTVLWCIAELGLACERIDAGHRYGVNDKPEFLAMNPNGTVPVLRDGDSAPLWESAAIVRYLAGRYGGAPFWPAEGMARAQVDKWAEWAKLNVSMPFTMGVFWKVVRTAPAARDHRAIGEAVARLDRFLDIAEARLAGAAYLAGEDFSVADIQFGGVLYRYFDVEIARPGRAALGRYYARLQERPAYREHVMVPYGELRVEG